MMPLRLALALGLALLAPSGPALAQVPTPPSFDRPRPPQATPAEAPRPRPPQVPLRPRPPEAEAPALKPYLEPPADAEALAAWAESSFERLRAQGMHSGGNERPWLAAAHEGVLALRHGAGLNPWPQRRQALAAMATAIPLTHEVVVALEGDLLADELGLVRDRQGPQAAGRLMPEVSPSMAQVLPHALVAKLVAQAAQAGPLLPLMGRIEAESAQLAQQPGQYPAARQALTGLRALGGAGRLRHEAIVVRLAQSEAARTLAMGGDPTLRRNRLVYLHLLGDLPQLP